MAKIEYTGLVSNIRGKIGGTVASGWKGINYLKSNNPNPRQPRTELQQDVKGYMSSLSAEWYGLGDAEKLLWNKYASLQKKPMTGQNAYIKLNLNIWRYITSAHKITAPPATPSRPGAITGMSAASVDSTHNQVSWITPDDGAITVIIDYSPQACFDDKSSPGWTYAANVASSYKITTLTHSFPSDTILKYRAKTMDIYGRMSPQSNIHNVTTP